MPDQRIPVDTEHLGIRVMMPVLTIVGLLGGYFLGSVVMGRIDQTIEGACLGIPMALAGTILLAQIGENIIKPNWSSGRYITVDEQALVMHDRRGGRREDTVIDWQEPVQVSSWYFDVPMRRNRVPKGWFCASVELHQSEKNVILYTFIKPEAAQEIDQFEQRFQRLLRTRERGGVKIDDARQAAQQKKLRQLESLRWEDGAEVSPEDFRYIMRYVILYA